MCWLVLEGLGVEESSRTSRTTFEGLGLARYSDGRAGFGVETSHVTLHLLLSPTLKPLRPYAPKPLSPYCRPPADHPDGPALQENNPIARLRFSGYRRVN